MHRTNRATLLLPPALLPSKLSILKLLLLKLLLLTLLLLTLVPLALQASTSIQSSYTTSQHVMTSKTLKRNFHLLVQTPKNLSSDQKYPTIYLLDGGITFSVLSGYYRYLRLQGSVPEAIIVGIAYPGETFEQGNYRSNDYTAPSPERSYWGGAKQFQFVLSDEILPFIEQAYPSNKQKRAIFGQSIGGQFVLFNAKTKPELFSGHIASNPALHRNLNFFLTDYTLTSSKLYMSSAANDDERFRLPALEWIRHIKNAEIRNVKTETLEDHEHFTTAPEAFRRGLRWWNP